MVEKNKLKEKLERRKRYILEKEYSNALKRGPVTDRAIAVRQHKFCVKLIKDMLDDEACLSFSKPVTELWDIDELPGYFNKVRFIRASTTSARARARLTRMCAARIGKIFHYEF